MAQLYELERSERIARERFPLIFGDKSPFTFVKALDTRAERPPSVIQVRYSPEPGRKLIGLGEWPEELISPVSPGSWVEEPTPGQDLAIKLRMLRSRYIHRDLYAHLIGNRLFTPDQDARIPRLYGYGVGAKYPRQIFSTDVQRYIEVDEPDKYLVFEYLEPRFKELGKSEAFKKGISPKRVIGLGLQIADVLQNLHTAGIVHMDLLSEGLDEHVRWDETNNSVRIIDFGDAKVSILDRNWRSRLFMDQESLGRFLVLGLLGDKVNWQSYEDELRERLSPDVSTPLLQVITMCIGENQDGEKTNHYPRSAAGTGQIYEQLSEINELLSAK